MEKFTVLNGLVAPLDRANVDTDQIIPKEHLKSIKRTGFADALFAAWRHDPQFMLNRPQYKGASILLARKNFGCGSSREHAPWALVDYGFRCVIAPSFADIFFTNCYKNGLLPVALREDEVDRLFYEAAAFPGFKLIINLEEQTAATVDNAQVMRFDIDPFRKYCLINGLDEIGLTLRHAEKIRTFEVRRQTLFPWYF
jgi:3-isopropylmalate/(R)-2-methylmalate dehydratase small subunit